MTQKYKKERILCLSVVEMWWNVCSSSYINRCDTTIISYIHTYYTVLYHTVTIWYYLHLIAMCVKRTACVFRCLFWRLRYVCVNLVTMTDQSVWARIHQAIVGSEDFTTTSLSWDKMLALPSKMVIYGDLVAAGEIVVKSGQNIDDRF